MPHLPVRDVPADIDEDRFWKFVAHRNPLQCWPWLGSLAPSGYGQFAVRFAPNKAGWRPLLAHRVAYVLTNGPIPVEKPHVLHSCDNPVCCNPRHLFVGTHRDNMQDMVRKGRYAKTHTVKVFGDAHGNTRISDDQVREIRRRYAAGKTTFRALGDQFGISNQHVSDIVHRKKRSRVDA